MNESLQDRFDRLTIELKERRRYYRNSFRNVIIFCVIILIFFSLYSALICYKIQELATPSTIALLISSQLRENFSDAAKAGRINYRMTADDMSQSALLALPLSIHAAGEFLRESMDYDARSSALQIAESLTDTLHRNIDRIAGQTVPSGNGESSCELSETRINELVRQGSNLMFPVPFHFGGRLRDIRLKRNIPLTRQELCDRDFMLCWTFLNENERYRDCRYSSVLMAFSSLFVRSWEEAADSSLETPQNSTKNNPMQKNSPARQ